MITTAMYQLMDRISERLRNVADGFDETASAEIKATMRYVIADLEELQRLLEDQDQANAGEVDGGRGYPSAELPQLQYREQ